MANPYNMAAFLEQHSDVLLTNWIKEQLASPLLRKDLMPEKELRQHSQQFIKELITSLKKKADGNLTLSEWEGLRNFLKGISESRGEQGFTSLETAAFIFSFKQPLFTKLQEVYKEEPSVLAASLATSSIMLDDLGLFTVHTYQNARENVIRRQQEELLELSTPVVKLWEGILALPMIGTLDSNRTQIVMENLLQSIVSTGSEIAIIDITGVPNVDTLVAQHLLKTVAATRLMGADCIISGIRPQIAQTIVHLGVDLGNVVTKATLADAFKLAISRIKQFQVDTDVLNSPQGHRS